MRKLALVFSLCALACGNNDNLVVGGIGAGPSNDGGPSSPEVVFDNIGSAISGKTTLTDANGNPTGNAVAVILSDRPALCSILAAHPDYFRKPFEGYLAMIHFIPVDPPRLGTFEPGRPGDEGTGSEIIAVNSPPQPTLWYFRGIDTGYIALTNLNDDGSSSGSFQLIYNDYLNAGGHPFYGKFRTSGCAALAHTLLP